MFKNPKCFASMDFDAEECQTMKCIFSVSAVMEYPN